ncbi:MAG: hypothetical protein ACT4P3_20615 [Betaproteobacteria bacterium]
MTGTGLIALILISMGWLFYLYCLVLHYALLRRSLNAKPGEYVASSLGFVPGVAGSITAFFTVGQLAGYGVDVPWPWLWILLPLFIDPYAVPIFVLLMIRKLHR